MVANLASTPEGRNASVSRQGLEMLRIVNRANLSLKRRAEILGRIAKIDELFGTAREAFLPGPDAVWKIRTLTAKKCCSFTVVFGFPVLM
jgi:hypothetical protein